MTNIITWDQINAFRLKRHFLTKRAPRTAIASVVSSVCGIQAQMLPAALLQLWTRIENLMPQDVTDALWGSKLLLRTWCMRGTAHYITTNQFQVYLKAIIEPRIPQHKKWLKKRGMREFGELAKIDPSQHNFEAILTAVIHALAGGPATRDDVAKVVAEEVGPEAGPWVDTGYYIVTKLLAYEGKICFGPELDGKVSLVLTDQWLPKQSPVEKEKAEDKILINYLQSYGPATPQDFSAWSGLKMTTVKPIWERNKRHHAEVLLNGKSRWLLEQDLDTLLETPVESHPVRLLPNFDIFLLGHKDKSHIVDEGHYKRVFKKAAWIAPVLLCDGRAIGTWKHKRTSKKLIVNIEPFAQLTKIQRNDVEVEVQRLGDFFDLTHEIKYL
ncbi:MAG: winged helix DNA-binding domain-containing protein [Promethearchaeota archaeon]